MLSSVLTSFTSKSSFVVESVVAKSLSRVRVICYFSTGETEEGDILTMLLVLSLITTVWLETKSLLPYVCS